MKANPSPKFRLGGNITDETLVLGIPHKRFKELLEEGFADQFAQIREFEKSKAIKAEK